MPKYAVTLHTQHFRGDHAKDVTIAVYFDPEETVDELMRRIGVNEPWEHVEIRKESVPDAK